MEVCVTDHIRAGHREGHPLLKPGRVSAVRRFRGGVRKPKLNFLLKRSIKGHLRAGGKEDGKTYQNSDANDGVLGEAEATVIHYMGVVHKG
eukprot:3484672-Pleurochrysis_carterae.AAC.1